MMALPAEVAAPEYGLIVGAGYTWGKNGSSAISAPAELSAKLDSGRALFLLDGEYDWTRSSPGNAQGFGAPTFTFVYRLTEQASATDSLAVRATDQTPSGTDVSSTNATQALALLWNHKFTANDWTRLSAWVNHTNVDVPAGVAAYGTLGKIYYQHKFIDDKPVSDWFVSLSYAHRTGAVNATVVSGGIDFPLTPTAVGPFKEITGTLFGFCKLSAGQHCGHIEFDLNMPFR